MASSLLYPPGDPVITSVQDASGPPAGGTLVTINGENLGCVTSISFGSNEAEAFTNEEAILDCGSSLAVDRRGTSGHRGCVGADHARRQSRVTSRQVDAPATSPTDFTYDTANPSVTSSLAFGSVNLASSSTQTVTVSNPTSASQPLYPAEPTGRTRPRCHRWRQCGRLQHRRTIPARARR